MKKKTTMKKLGTFIAETTQTKGKKLKQLKGGGPGGTAGGVKVPPGDE